LVTWNPLDLKGKPRILIAAMTILYVTGDQIGDPTGGGQVTGFECDCLASMGEELARFDSTIIPSCDDPFEMDERYCLAIQQFVRDRGVPRLCHFYAGCFTMTIEFLKSKGASITYTVDAHDSDRSVEEWGRCGMEYPFVHISDRNLRAIYTKGYTLADAVIVPSVHSERIMKALGCARVVLIPHAVRTFPDLDYPERFTVGHIGVGGPDKGLKYLLEAWNIPNSNGARLVMAGNNIDTVMPIWRRNGGRNIELMGIVERQEIFYKRISIYVQPSVTEGFGIPVIEAMACGRPVIVSEGAGAVDALISNQGEIGIRVPIRDPKAIAEAIQFYMDNPENILEHGREAKYRSRMYSQDLIREKYVGFWRTL